MRAPWRPADITDSIRHESTREPLARKVSQELGDVDFEVALPYDTLFAILIDGAGGRPQPLMWRMDTRPVAQGNLLTMDGSIWAYSTRDH